MITRREFIKALGALVGTGAIGSVVKPVEAIAAEGAGGIGIGTPLCPPTPVHIVDDAGNVRYPVVDVTSAAWVEPAVGASSDDLHDYGAPIRKEWPAS